MMQMMMIMVTVAH